MGSLYYVSLVQTQVKLPSLISYFIAVWFSPLLLPQVILPNTAVAQISSVLAHHLE